MDYPALLRQHRIKLTGLDAPNPIASFADLTANHACPQLIADNWVKMGMNNPTGIQMASWGIMLEVRLAFAEQSHQSLTNTLPFPCAQQKRDILACAPTGSGKTLSFVLPLLALNPPSTEPTGKAIRPTSIIIEPTRELAMQVLREVNKLGEGGGWGVKVLGEEERAARSGMPVKRRKGRKGKRAKKVSKVEGEGKKGKKVASEDEESESDSEEEEDVQEDDEPVGEKEAAAVPSTPTGEPQPSRLRKRRG